MVDPLLTRRIFLTDVGRGALAVAVIGVAACTPNRPSFSSPASSSGGPPAGPSGADPSRSGGAATPAPAAPSSSVSAVGPAVPGGVAWARVNLGFVSAYLLVRDGEGAIVDTGVAGSEDAIATVMKSLGLAWTDIGNVILTHRHPDHVGSLGAILDLAPEAVGWIGAGDLPAVQSRRPLTAVGDGDEVFGLRIVATPGHTVGHIAVLDEVGGLLVAGDALGTIGGPLAGSNPQFTEDATAARATVVKLGKLAFETLLVGHGEPILTGASAQVAALGRG